MKNKFLLPRAYSWLGLVILLPGLLFGLTYLFDYHFAFLDVRVPDGEQLPIFARETYQAAVALTLLISSMYMIGFSRKKNEDEFIDFIRYQSLLLATVIQSAVLVISSWFIGGLDFILVMVFNLVSFLAIFNIVFVIRFIRSKSRMTHEE